MKKVIAVITMVMLAGCGDVAYVPSYWIKIAEDNCKNNGGVHTLGYSTSVLFKHEVTCNDGYKKVISQ